MLRNGVRDDPNDDKLKLENANNVINDFSKRYVLINTSISLIFKRLERERSLKFSINVRREVKSVYSKNIIPHDCYPCECKK